MKKRLKKWSAYLLTMSLILSMGVPGIVNAESSKKTKAVTGQADGVQKEQKERGEKKFLQTTAEKQSDVTKPVIEKIEFPQNGQTLKAGDTLKFYVYAYDADSEIKTVDASLDYSKKGTSVTSDHLTGVYDETDKRYEMSCTISKKGVDSAALSYIKVVDANNNYAEWNQNMGRYQIDIESEDFPVVHVRNFTMTPNQQTVADGTEIAYAFELEGEELPAVEDRIEVAFRNTVNNHPSVSYASFDETDGMYKGKTVSTDGKWELNGIYQETNEGTWNFRMENMKNFWYETEEEAESSIPKITSIQLEKNGETLKKGDEAALSIRVESEQEMSANGTARFQAVASIAEGVKSIPLEYDAKTGTYTGVFEVTGDTYPCEWYLSELSVSDISGVKADASEAYPDLQANDPFYLYVTDGTAFVNPTYDINVNFQALNADGQWVQVKSFSKSDVERRTTLKEAGLTLPEMEDSYPGLKQTGWVDSNGQKIDENTPILSQYIGVYAQYDKIPVTIRYDFVDESGKWISSTDTSLAIFPAGSTYQDAFDYVAEQSGPDVAYPGIKFQSWEILNGTSNADEPLGVYSHIYASALYDKNVTNVDYIYPDKDSKLKTAGKVLLTEKGTTNRELRQKIEEYQIQDGMPGLEFTGWEGFMVENDEAVEQSNVKWKTLYAAYKGKEVIRLIQDYYDARGLQKVKEEKVAIVESGASQKEITEILSKQELPSIYEGLRFSKWDIFPYGAPGAAGYQRYYMDAVYENYLVRYILDDRFRGDWVIGTDEPEFEYIECKVVEKGETVTVPVSFDGYKNVTWVYRSTEEDTFKAEHDMVFWGYGDKDDSKPTDPEQPDKPTDPEEPDNPTEPEEPDKPVEPDKPTEPENPVNPQLPQDKIDNIVNDVNNASDGASITVPMDGATVVPKDVLEAAKGKDVEIKLDMGGYTWTIKGKDIFAENLKDINLEVKQNTNAIPSKVIQSLAGDNPTQQLSLTHNGDFGFKADLTINVGSEHQGKYGNLFYYDSDGKVVFINAGKVDENGNVTLSFSHASDYVVVMDEQKMSDNNVPENLRPDKKGDGAVKTGDSSHATLPVIMAILAIFVFAAAARRKRNM